MLRRHPSSCQSPNVIAGRLRDFAALPLSEAETRPPANAKKWKNGAEVTSQTSADNCGSMEAFGKHGKQISVEIGQIVDTSEFR